MALERIAAFSLAGDAAKPNEDAFGDGPFAAVVIDGATNLGDALMPGGNDAAWLARFGARRLMAHAGEDKSARKALRDALGDAQKSFDALRRAEPEAMWQLPSAAMMFVKQVQARLPIVRVSAQEGEVVVAGSAPSSRAAPASGARVASEDRRGSTLEFLSFGDCAALVERPGQDALVIGATFENRAREAQRAAMLAKEKNLDPASGLNRPEFLIPLRGARNHINSGSHWRFSPDAAAAAHAARRIVEAAAGTHLLLATDGFIALASDYGAYDAEGLLRAAKDKGLEALGEELRIIEGNDPLGRQYPRFKKSDDATALLLRVTEWR